MLNNQIMMDNNMKKNTITTMIASLMFLIVIALFVIPNSIAPNIIGVNHKNVTVWTYVNITNSKPEVINVTVYAENNFSMRNITLNAGASRIVYCNATVRDWNGFNNIVYVNATLWHASATAYDDPDNNNTHYTNSSCTINESLSAYIGWYVCAFDVLYYANNGTWNCNVTVTDPVNKSGWKHNTTIFYPLYALNVTDGIDYGNVAVEEYSGDKTANVTNLGNMGINITVEGYGTRRGDGLAMNCSISGNITVGNERYATESGIPWDSKTPLTSTLGGALLRNLTMPKQTDPNTFIVNATYWELYIPPNPAGNCSGWILFTATNP